MTFLEYLELTRDVARQRLLGSIADSEALARLADLDAAFAAPRAPEGSWSGEASIDTRPDVVSKELRRLRGLLFDSLSPDGDPDLGAG